MNEWLQNKNNQVKGENVISDKHLFSSFKFLATVAWAIVLVGYKFAI